jgi:hypothetical protein
MQIRNNELFKREIEVASCLNKRILGKSVDAFVYKHEKHALAIWKAQVPCDRHNINHSRIVRLLLKMTAHVHIYHRRFSFPCSLNNP